MKSFGGDAMELHDPTVIFALIEHARQRYESSIANGRKEEEKEGELAKGWNWKRVDFEIEWSVLEVLSSFSQLLTYSDPSLVTEL